MSAIQWQASSCQVFENSVMTLNCIMIFVVKYYIKLHVGYVVETNVPM